MRIETKTFTVEYKVFDVGEKVKPTSPRCSLPEGVYTITKCIPPHWPGDDTIVFVEGQETGVSGEYLTSAEQP